MSKVIGMPEVDIKFRHLGATAFQRGEKGQAILVVKEEKAGEPILTLASLGGLTKEIEETFSPKNIAYIQDVLAEKPKELVVVRLQAGAEEIDTFDLDDEEVTEDENGDIILKNLAEALSFVKTKAERNCWISVADMTQEDAKTLTSFIAEANKFDRKRYKAVVYKHDADDMHIVNFTTEKVRMKDEKQMRDGVTLVPMVLGAVAGQSLNSSLVGRKFPAIDYVIEPEDGDQAVDDGELFFFNDEGVVRFARGVNSLTTIEDGMTNDMRFILVVEVMDLVYTDIINTWVQSYRGLFKNNLDNQMLLVSALNGYYRGLEADYILDNAFDNRVVIDTNKQRLANLPIYGEAEVSGWDENKVLAMTVGTNVYLKANLKINNAMEDLYMDILM